MRVISSYLAMQYHRNSVILASIPTILSRNNFYYRSDCPPTAQSESCYVVDLPSFEKAITLLVVLRDV